MALLYAVEGSQLWQYDPVAGTTEPVRPSSGSAPTLDWGGDTLLSNGVFYGSASSGPEGLSYEAWQFDLTTGQFSQIADAAPSDCNAYPFGFTALNGQVYFAARSEFGGPCFQDEVRLWVFGDAATAIEDPRTDTFRVEVYPNPVSQVARVRLELEREQAITASLHDLVGRHIATVFDGAASASHVISLELETSELAAGVYVIRIAGEERVVSRRIVVLH